MEDTAKLLASLAVLAARTEAERKILDAARTRLDEVRLRLQAARESAVAHGSNDYQALICERGALERVLALAQMRLDTSA